MLVLGVTGGVGSGKTAILQYLKERYNARVYLADEVAKKLLEPGQKCYEKVRQLFPDTVFTKNGEIHKEKMAELIFHYPELRKKQNKIVFPEVRHFIEEQIKAENLAGTKIFVVEAALLIEEHYDEICDQMWYIYTSEDNRRRRLKENRGYGDEKITAIMKSQLSEEDFLRHADVVIDNNGSLEEAYEWIDKEMQKILKGPKKAPQKD